MMDLELSWHEYPGYLFKEKKKPCDCGEGVSIGYVAFLILNSFKNKIDRKKMLVHSSTVYIHFPNSLDSSNIV